MQTRHIAALAIAITGLTFVGRSAVADEVGDSYEKYYQAIEVKTLCEDSGAPDKATLQKIAGYIADQNKFALTAGQSLTAIENAKSAARKMVKDSGCDDRSVQQLIGLYHATEAAAQ